MAGKLVGFWNNAFRATYERFTPSEPLASEEVVAATVGGIVSAYLHKVVENPKTSVSIEFIDDFIQAKVSVQFMEETRATHFTAATEEELISTVTIWIQEIVQGIIHGR